MLTSIAIENDATKPFLSRYFKEIGMEKVAKGVYITDDVCGIARLNADKIDYGLLVEAFQGSLMTKFFR